MGGPGWGTQWDWWKTGAHVGTAAGLSLPLFSKPYQSYQAFPAWTRVPHLIPTTAL